MMAPSISRSCAVSRSMRAIVLLSISAKITRPTRRGKGARSFTSLLTGHLKRKAGRELRPAGCRNSVNRSSAWFLHVGSLRTFRPLHNFEFDYISFLQCAVTVSDDGGIVNEHIRAIVTPDEAITFGVIEPFHGATQAYPPLNKSFSFRFAARRRA